MDRDYDQRESLAEQQAIQERNDRIRHPSFAFSRASGQASHSGREVPDFTPVLADFKSTSTQDQLAAALARSLEALQRPIVQAWLEDALKSPDAHERLAADVLLRRLRRLS